MNNVWCSLALGSYLLFVFVSCESQQLRQEKYSNGNLKEKFYVIETENGSFLKHGEYKSWYRNGSVKFQGSYAKGKKVGRWQSWYENGQKESDGSFKDDSLHGAYLSYFPDGKESSEGSFFHGKQSGSWSFWSNNGTLINKSNYNNRNQLHGVQLGWNENGSKLFEENYSNGKRNGLCKQWNLDGSLYVNAVFKNGSLDGLPASFITRKGEILELLSSKDYKIKFLSNMDNFNKWEWKEISGTYSFRQDELSSLSIYFGNEYLYQINLNKLTNDTIQSEQFLFIKR